jgi:thiol-disulfide isomerase/thioredoxin
MRPLFPSIIGFLICFYTGNLFAQQQEVKVFDVYDRLESYTGEYAKSTVVINFWATYCGPCVQEIPYFDSLQQKYIDHNVKVILVSLDFRHHIQERLMPFLEKHHLKTEVVVLADQDADSWVSRVSADWDGGLPFTILLKKGQKYIHTSEFRDFNDLEQFVMPHIDPKQSLAAKRR